MTSEGDDCSDKKCASAQTFVFTDFDVLDYTRSAMKLVWDDGNGMRRDGASMPHSCCSRCTY